jgi:hypothetical protein
MKKMRFWVDDERRPDAGDEGGSEHERNRRIKSERDRLLRRRLARLRSAGVEDEREDGLPVRG